ncbi:hypothetical protein [Pediococcus cellicola]|uniref:hypothetical protein n=1 Tax=Pediococcus cellicola TaxID=319652 RepID=UPI00070C74E0|nr:hypothetical protein [Pediococcus cellicola]GEL15946.1 hypothetical protein PCE01_17480 [Pediococcus cellicola]
MPSGRQKNFQNKNTVTELTLTTKILDGVKLNAQLRAFLETYYKTPHFKFSKQMAVAIRQAKHQDNTTMTI